MLVENEAIKWIFIMCWQEHIVCFLKLATCGNIRPHILQIKLCRVHCGPISDEICGQIRFSGKNLDTKIISGLGGQKMPLTFTLHPICIEEEGQKNSNLKVGKMSFLANSFPVCFKVFTFGFLWISCELSSIALQVSRGLIAVLVACNCGNLPLRATRNLKTHMSAKHGRHGENCDPSEHKSRRPAPVLSTIDISASSAKSTNFKNCKYVAGAFALVKWQANAMKLFHGAHLQITRAQPDAQVADLRIGSTLSFPLDRWLQGHL